MQATKSGIPPGARWTKIDRRLVNPEALEEAKERFEERLDCVIVLRVLTKEEIQKLADRTKEIRGKYRPSHSSKLSRAYTSPDYDNFATHHDSQGPSNKEARHFAPDDDASSP
jgi:bisphosphoglycerate-independent phosphoglycerate mutase (AlkP superfamily)